VHSDALRRPTETPIVPRGQGRHVELEFAPSASEKVPAGQGRHAESSDAPASGAYVPAPHRVQELVPLSVE
jgi:hypothetical protein